MDKAQQAVSPLWGEAKWRGTWMALMAALPDDKSAASSLVELEKHLPTDSNDEHMLLAVTWNVMGTRTKTETYEKNAFRILEMLDKNPANKQYLQDFGTKVLASPQENQDGVNLWAHWFLNKTTFDEAQKAIQPLLSTIFGRLNWIDLAADIQDPAIAGKWLETAEKAIETAGNSSSDTNVQKYALATMLKEVGDRSTTPATLKAKFLESSVRLVEPSVTKGLAPQRAQVLLALVYEDQENYAAATDIYRALIKPNSDDAVAMNNLANLLVKTKKKTDGPEAIRLISQAIKLQPKIATFYDTQAADYAILLQDYKSALESVQAAISLEPANLDWRVSRIWILAMADQHAVASAEFDQLKKEDISRLSPDSRERLRKAGLQ
jgi:tetratricopeptide (TPR) repeat protein